ncbi:FAD-binding oxidoreductase [Streptomyces fractus]|uniref:FAD-binding oxidoreductase n=1 Tax=Streptomyces fractus TaxID=641806 RepID=UPI003CEAB7EC
MTDVLTTTPSPQRTAAIGEFTAAVTHLLGDRGVVRDEPTLTKASRDWAHLSPILAAKLPGGRAEVVVRPERHEQISGIVALAHRHRVPLTARGKGTGNYGQAIPLNGGAVLDLTGCNRVLEVGDGWIRVEAGARMSALEAQARRHGQELWMFPSTVGSTIGGFLAGGNGGTGSLVHRTTTGGFVKDLTVVPCTDTARPFTLHGEDALPYLHAYGTSGVLAAATVRLQPAREWTGFFSAFDDWSAATAALADLVALEPPPRLVSLDEAGLVATFPPADGLDPAALSLRAIIEADAEPAARAIIDRHGGRVLDVRPAPHGPGRLTSLSFNHPTYHLMKAHDGYFHLEVSGEALLGDPTAIRRVFPGTLLHLEGMRTGTVGILMARYEDAHTVYEGINSLAVLGVSVHDPHNWFVDRRVDLVRDTARTTDPLGLLNPGHLPPATKS